VTFPRGVGGDHALHAERRRDQSNRFGRSSTITQPARRMAPGLRRGSASLPERRAEAQVSWSRDPASRGRPSRPKCWRPRPRPDRIAPPPRSLRLASI